MKLLLIGAGSVGCYFCGRAAVGGADVEVLIRRNMKEIRKKGYEVKSIAGDFEFHPSRVLSENDEISPDIDAVILATKVLPETDRIGLLKKAASLPSGPPIVLIQNGIGIEDEIAEAYPDNEIISCIAYIGASRKNFREIIHSGAGRLILGRFGGGESPFAGKLAEFFASAGECPVWQRRILLWKDGVNYFGICRSIRYLCLPVVLIPEVCVMVKRLSRSVRL